MEEYIAEETLPDGAARWGEIRMTEGYGHNELPGVVSSAQQMEALIPTRAEQMAAGVNPDRSFLFASSYGALTARRLMDDLDEDERPFGGIVTLGGVNGGTTAADARVELIDAAANFGVTVARAPIVENLEGMFFVSWFNIDRLYGSLTNGIPDLLTAAFPIVENGFNVAIDIGDNGVAFGLPPTRAITDMSPTSAVVTGLSETDPDFPSVTIVNVEQEDDLLWRFLNAVPVGNPISRTRNPDAPIQWTFEGLNYEDRFSSNDDEPFLTDMINNEAHYLNRWHTWRDRRSAAPRWGDWYGGTHYSRNEMETLRNNWREGYFAIFNFDDVYKGTSGFQEDEFGWVETGGFCTCNSSGFPFTFPTTNEAHCSQSACGGYFTPGARRWQLINRTYFPNDGIVTEASQASWGNRRVDQPGDNHFQKSNSRAHQRAVQRILNGDAGGQSGDFFRSVR